MQGGNGDETLKGQEKAYSRLSFVQGVDVPVKEVQGSFIAAGQSQLRDGEDYHRYVRVLLLQFAPQRTTA